MAVTDEVEEALVGPVAGRDEEDEQQDGAVDAGAVEIIGQKEEGDDKADQTVSEYISAKNRWGPLGAIQWRGIGRDEQKRQPAAVTLAEP